MHLVRAFLVAAIYTALLGGVFALSTTQVFAVRLWSGIWWFALVLMITLVVFIAIGFTFYGNYPVGLRWLLLLIGLALVAATIVLGTQYDPFNPKNIDFRLGALFGGDDHFGTVRVDDLPPPRPEVTWATYLPAPIDQGNCQSCWAVSAAGMLSTRKNIQDGGPPKTKRMSCLQDHEVQGWHFSPQALVDLDTARGPQGKCNPSFLSQGITLATRGVVSSQCVPNFSALGPRCNSKCGSPVTRTSGTDVCIIPGTNSNTWTACTEPGQTPTILRALAPRRLAGEEIMKREISQHGPIICMLNFYHKANGAYPAWTLSDTTLFGKAQYTFVSPGFVVRPQLDGNEYTKESRAGNHMVIVFGYGVSGDGVPYWDVRNSWGNWGDKGNIKIERGVDAWNIESHCFAADVSS